MIDKKGFEEWMRKNSVYSQKQIEADVQTVLAADRILAWKDEYGERLYEVLLREELNRKYPQIRNGISSFMGALRMYGVFVRNPR